MKSILTSLCAVLILGSSLMASWDVPHLINYQGRLTDAGGTPLPDGPKSIRFIIWEDPTSTNPIYEVWNSGPLTVNTVNGLFSVQLGASPQPVLDPLAATDSLLWLGITVGADPELSPRTRLTSVPFAFTAQNSKYAHAAGLAYTVENNAISSSNVLNGSLNITDLDATAIPTLGVIDIFPSGTAATTATLLSTFTVDVPAAGYLLVTVSGQYYFDINAPANTSVIEFGYFGLCDSPNSSASCDNTYNSYWYQDAEDASPDFTNTTNSFTIQRVVAVPAPGPRTFYINGQGTGSSILFFWGTIKVTALFTPGGMSMSSPEPPAGQDNPSPQQFDSQQE